MMGTGDDGGLYVEDDEPEHWHFGPTFGYDPESVYRNAGPEVPRQPDVVGVGIERGADGNEQMFCTKNGALVGDSVLLPRSPKYFFAFALETEGDRASLNTGSARFVFDLEAYSQQPPRADRYVPVGRDTDEESYDYSDEE